MSEIKIPTVGRTVIYFPSEQDSVVENNGVTEAPAVVVQTFGEHDTINLSVHTFNPDAPVVLRYSVPHKSRALKNDEGKIIQRCWDWPEIK